MEASEGMQRSTVDLNGKVVTVRRLRAAASLPKVLAWCCVAIAFLVVSASCDDRAKQFWEEIAHSSDADAENARN